MSKYARVWMITPWIGTFRKSFTLCLKSSGAVLSSIKWLVDLPDGLGTLHDLRRPDRG
jgi:hypothetical protein